MVQCSRICSTVSSGATLMARQHWRTSRGMGFAYVSLIGLAAMSHAQETFASDEWDRADKEVVRLAPEAFDELPRQVKKELTRRG